MSSQRAGKRRIIPDSDGEDESASQVSPPSKRARRRGADTDGLSPTPQADGSGHGAASQGIGGDAEDDAEDGVLVKLSQTPRAGGSERNADGCVRN